MARAVPSAKEMIAFKIGARARKFVMEGCPVEGYEVLLTALAEAEQSDPQLHVLLRVEMDKFEKRLSANRTNAPDERKFVWRVALRSNAVQELSLARACWWRPVGW